MDEMKRISLPMDRQTIDSLRAGDTVLLSGLVYSARDAAHLRMARCLGEGGRLPFDLREQTIFYLGPSETRPGQVIGVTGPTSSYRMDPVAPLLLEYGLQAMIGKGPRSAEVTEAVKKQGAVYFAAVGGTAALLSKHIAACRVIAYEDLGAEAIRELELKDFPVVVALDRYGGDQYSLGPQTYRQKGVEDEAFENRFRGDGQPGGPPGDGGTGGGRRPDYRPLQRGSAVWRADRGRRP